MRSVLNVSRVRKNLSRKINRVEQRSSNVTLTYGVSVNARKFPSVYNDPSDENSDAELGMCGDPLVCSKAHSRFPQDKCRMQVPQYRYVCMFKPTISMKIDLPSEPTDQPSVTVTKIPLESTE